MFCSCSSGCLNHHLLSAGMKETKTKTKKKQQLMKWILFSARMNDWYQRQCFIRHRFFTFSINKNKIFFLFFSSPDGWARDQPQRSWSRGTSSNVSSWKWNINVHTQHTTYMLGQSLRSLQCCFIDVKECLEPVAELWCVKQTYCSSDSNKLSLCCSSAHREERGWGAGGQAGAQEEALQKGMAHTNTHTHQRFELFSFTSLLRCIYPFYHLAI